MTIFIGEPEADYRMWTASTISDLHAAIAEHAGGSGDGGVYDRVQFAFGMEHGDEGKIGVVQFVTTLRSGLGQGRSKRTKFEWYAHPDTAKVASDLVAAYRELSDKWNGKT
jgi:hypothetical protein